MRLTQNGERNSESRRRVGSTPGIVHPLAPIPTIWVGYSSTMTVNTSSPPTTTPHPDPPHDSPPTPPLLAAPPKTFFFHVTATTEIYTLSLHDALPIYRLAPRPATRRARRGPFARRPRSRSGARRHGRAGLQPGRRAASRLVPQARRRAAQRARAPREIGRAHV